MTITLSFVSFSDKVAFNQKNGIMPADMIDDGPCWEKMKDDGVKYENSPHVYMVKRE